MLNKRQRIFFKSNIKVYKSDINIISKKKTAAYIVAVFLYICAIGKIILRKFRATTNMKDVYISDKITHDQLKNLSGNVSRVYEALPKKNQQTLKVS